MTAPLSGFPLSVAWLLQAPSKRNITRIMQIFLIILSTQSDLAKKLNITRSSVNAWEMVLSPPSTAYLVELSQLFHVSTDYLLGISGNASLDISNLSEKEVQIVYDLVQYFRNKK